MKKFCSPLRAHATYMISFEKKKLLSLTKEGLKLHQDSTLCYICRKNTQKLSKDKRFIKLGTIAILWVNLEELHIAFVT